MKLFFRRLVLMSLCLTLLAGLLPGCAGQGDDPTQTTETTGTAGSTDGTTVPDKIIENPNYQPDPDDGIYDVGYEELPYSQAEIYEQLFDLNNKIEIDLDMPETELQKLQQDYEDYREMGSKSPIYRMADITITITTADGATTYRINEVGVRMKGNTSRTSFYSQEEGIYKYIHLKLDFQETFDDEDYYGDDSKDWGDEDLRDARKDRTFATLEKLEMRWNKCYDSTYLKETYAYALYRAEGVLAPLTNLSSFDWSGVHMGIYTINEPVDEVFLEKRLPAEELGGDLYKCGWTYEGATFTNINSIGIEDEDKGEFYCYDLKSNKKTSQHEAMKNLIAQLNTGLVTKESFAALVDVENFLSFAAVSYFLGNPDDLRQNYNNFYLYFLQSSGKAIFIPYDYDRCLGVTVDYNPSGHAMTTDNPFNHLREGGQNGPAEQDNPLYIYSVDMGGYYVEEFAQALNRVAENELLKPETFETWFNTVKSHYENDVAPSKELHNAGGRDFSFDLYRTSAASDGQNMSFVDYITAKMTSFRGYMADLDTYLDYVRPVPANYYIRGTFNDWNIHDDYAMENADGVVTFTLSFSHDFQFKVYSKLQDAWYGSEAVSEETTVLYTSSGRTNISLGPGSYLVTFDPETQLITLTQM